ncbi:homocysteine S-methyltransferase family protein [Actinoplanes sp. NPDC020271]|uniref:homocysteine S-methyltransferase family protein n=1 Tax=Actinoplanes sp. NPDC020271 TaxID=3363896 RepID=UPI0037ACF17D
MYLLDRLREDANQAGSERLILDGGLSTELQRAGRSVSPPLWTSEILLSEQGRKAVRGIHAAYLRAGAEAITANTFRTGRATLAAAGLSESEARTVVSSALSEADAARIESGRLDAIIMASIAPVADCYQPRLVPNDDVLQAEHTWHAEVLADAGAEFALVETMNTGREAVIAATCARMAGLRVFVSFVCRAGGRLLSGESVADAATAATQAGAEAVLVNCTNVTDTADALAVLSQHATVPIGAYPNIEHRAAADDGIHNDRYFPPMVDHDGFAEILASWQTEFGASILGGCCGVSPEHITSLRRRLSRVTG